MDTIFIDLEDDNYSFITSEEDYEKACVEYVQHLLDKELIEIKYATIEE